ncbi:GNAT family N-acetyltransferase [Sphingomonas sp. TDK1]|uniref:GNAT family N-acetyltransferase n=1 Tax=Sphingomonas sp. TDK1 TaxID=453247 RepID=UPI0007D91B3D|nr:GNAT family N-acetyltransferase [Sphingomonas sp. TDK1]OAN59986.1 GCN5 family acetyltransferase [Sphingomonas sp. TDK1]
MIETARLLLRSPKPRDFEALHAMWSDPEVMRDLGPVKSTAHSRATIARHLGYGDSHGLGFQVVERRADGVVLGFCGLKPGAPDTPIEGELEIGWMFARSHWGQGYAREAAIASLGWAWRHRAEPRVVAITSACNLASRALMERLGMTWFTDFEHPVHPEGHRLRPTVAFAIRRP